MSTEARSNGRWLIAAVVVLAAAALALVLGPTKGGEAPYRAPIAAERPWTETTPLAWPDGPELDRSYELEPGEAFELAIDSGSVEVLAGETASARVRVSFSGGTRPPARFTWENTRTEQGTRLNIRADTPRSLLSRILHGDGEDEEILVEGERVKVSGKRARIGLVQVWLPPDSPLEVRSGAGSVTVSDRSAAVTLESGAGSLRLERIAASVVLDTGAGSIHVKDIAGDAQVETGAGDVTALFVLGDLDVDAGAGQVRFAGSPASVNIDTGAGGVDGSISELNGSVDIDTGMGGITLQLPVGCDARLRAESGLGSVRAELGGRRLEARRGEPLEETLGEGGPAIRLRTGTGGIRVREAPAAGSN
jgi:hypothetical protein